MKFPVYEQPARENQVKRSRQMRRKPPTVAHGGKTKQQSRKHEQEVHAPEGEKENAATVTRNDVAVSKSQRRARKPGDDEYLCGDERRIRENAAVP
jgi:hypothetical protein